MVCRYLSDKTFCKIHIDILNLKKKTSFVQICSLLRGGIAERGGVRVGHRIIEINNQSVVAVPHEKIVSLLANSVGEVISTLQLLKNCYLRLKSG